MRVLLRKDKPSTRHIAYYIEASERNAEMILFYFPDAWGIEDHQAKEGRN